MEVMLRVAVPDRPGALAALAGAIGDAGGDIEGVDVVESHGGRALDDVYLRIDPDALADMIARVRSLDGTELVHTSPSRGRPADVVTRFSLVLDSVLHGAMTPQEAATTLVGGLLRAAAVDVVRPGDAPGEADGILTLGFGDHVIVVRRDYRFTDTERQRAGALAKVCLQAAGARRLLHHSSG
jgi:hypothetical protein